MGHRDSTKHGGPELDVTPLIDVLLVLLIIFLVILLDGLAASVDLRQVP